MAKTCTALHFDGETVAAFDFYKSVFGTEFVGPVMHFGDLPANPDYPMSDADKKLVMRIVLPITGGHELLGNDVPAAMLAGGKLVKGNFMDLSIWPDTFAEAKRLFDGLSAGGTVEFPLGEVSEGQTMGSVVDKFGVNWQVNFSPAKS